jgi:signal transduction histidine kinase
VDLGFQRLDAPSNDKPLIVRGNPVLLREVIANLLDNALKYLPSARPVGANVTVTVAETTDEHGARFAEIAVEDNGAGVAPGLQADLFKRFFRGDRQTSADPGVEAGAGLGLAIVHDIMILHGGNVRYEDAATGGARFVLRVPIAIAGNGEPQPGTQTVPASA